MQKKTITAITIIASLAAVPAAQGKTYDAHLCQTATGQPNGPVENLHSNTVGTASTTETCSTTNGSISGQLDGVGPWFGGSVAEQTLKAPAGVIVDRVRVRRTVQGLGHGAGNAARIGYFLQDEHGTDIERREPFFNGLGVINGTFDSGSSPLGAATLRFSVSCNYSALRDCAKPTGQQPRFELRDLVLSLRDESTPAVSSVSTTLGNGPAAGVVPVTFNATDIGGGVYRPVYVINGSELPGAAIGGQCADANPTGGSAYQFNVLIPCPSGATVKAPLDTRTLPEGPNTVALYVEDAAGNRTLVWGPKAIIVDNREDATAPGETVVVNGPTQTVTQTLTKTKTKTKTKTVVVNGRNASKNARLTLWFVRTKGKKNTSRYGHRVVVRGFLRDAKGRGIVGAHVELAHVLGGKQLLKTGVKTRKGGAITFIAPMNVTTRSLRFSYKYRSTDKKPVTRQTLRLTVLPRNGAPAPLDREGGR